MVNFKNYVIAQDGIRLLFILECCNVLMQVKGCNSKPLFFDYFKISFYTVQAATKHDCLFY